MTGFFVGPDTAGEPPEWPDAPTEIERLLHQLWPGLPIERFDQRGGGVTLHVTKSRRADSGLSYDELLTVDVLAASPIVGLEGDPDMLAFLLERFFDIVPPGHPWVFSDDVVGASVPLEGITRPLIDWVYNQGEGPMPTT